MLGGFVVYNGEIGKICCGKIMSSFVDFIEKYGCYMNIGNRKLMWVYKKRMRYDLMCIFSGNVKNR